MTLAARLILFAVFAVAGVAKLLDREGSREAARGFGVPESLSGAVGLGLPVAELATAVLLLFPSTAHAGAIAALVLLGAFIVAIAAAMARGEAPDCHCFGAIHSEPAGAKTLVRNVVLAALAVFVLVSDAGASPWGWIANLDTTQTWLLAAVAVMALVMAAMAAFMFALLRQNGRILRRIDALEAGIAFEPGLAPTWDSAGHGLPVGDPAPAFELPGLDGVPVTLEQLRAPGRPVLLLFTDPACVPCNALMPDVGRWVRDYANELTIALVSRGDAAANRDKAAEHGIPRILLQHDREIAELYNATATPTGLAIDADGDVLLPAAPGIEAINALIEALTVPAAPALQVVPPAAPAPPAGVAVGSPAPALTLVDLDGEQIDLADPRSGGRMLLFWNPHCGFCERMLDDLRAWESAAPDDAPELIFVSTGSEEDNRAMGLRSRIALNPGFTVGAAFGASGTPSAILLDDRGHVASELGVGAPAVMALAGP
jgi:methylamine dehydrogenase accessory protein MauD